MSVSEHKPESVQPAGRPAEPGSTAEAAAPAGDLPAVRAPDRRVQRSRRAIEQAFLGLLQRRVYPDIHVGDITRKADVGRATFYEHYADKDDLLARQLERVMQLRLRPSQDGAAVDATELIAHVLQLPQVWQSFSAPAASLARQRVQLSLQQRLLQLLDAHPGWRALGPQQRQLTALAMAATLLALLAEITAESVAGAPVEAGENQALREGQSITQKARQWQRSFAALWARPDKGAEQGTPSQ